MTSRASLLLKLFVLISSGHLYVDGAGVTTEVGAILATIPDCDFTVNDDDGSIPTCTLPFGVYLHEGPSASFSTRNYLGAGLPGPTIRVRAGDIFQVNISNQLDKANNLPAGADMNLPHLPNTTNFHTHGLHISGLSPGDDVFASIEPGESLLYTFEIPENHMGGTFWYHPHHHGAVSLQLGGGACGLIIVEDEPGSLPPQIQGMEDVSLLMQYIEPNRIKQIQTLFDDHLLQTSGGSAPVFVTNGQTSPLKYVESGIWTRFRIMYTSVSHLLILSQELNTDNGASCEIQLLAKDGVYLIHAPRLIDNIYLPEGGRADVAIRCVGEGKVNFLAAVQSRLTYVALTLDVSEKVPTSQPTSQPTPQPTLSNIPTSQPTPQPTPANIPTSQPTSQPSTILPTSQPDTVGNADDTTDDVEDDVEALIRESTLRPFAVHRPCYLADTRSTTPTTYEELTLGTGTPNTKLNGVFYSSKDESLNPTNPFITGTLGEISIVQGTYVHVLHIHVNPFQLAQMSPVVDTVYFQEGDWHDTLNVFIAQANSDEKMNVRMWMDKFAGHAVVHCHMLNDEDAGMMNTYLVEGEEGASVDEVAKLVDPLCYTDLTRGYVLE